MLYREMIAICSHVHIKRKNTLYGENENVLNFKLAVYIVTTEL